MADRCFHLKMTSSSSSNQMRVILCRSDLNRLVAVVVAMEKQQVLVFSALVAAADVADAAQNGQPLQVHVFACLTGALEIPWQMGCAQSSIWSRGCFDRR